MLQREEILEISRFDHPAIPVSSLRRYHRTIDFLPYEA
jgi:hypothetical protein